MIAADLASLAVPVGDLQLLPGNPRRGDVGAVAASLEAFGQRKPIVVRKSDNTVIAGNHTLQAAQELGWSELAVVWVDDDDATAKAFALADNRTAELGTYDEAALAALVAEVLEADEDLLRATGWEPDDLAEMLRRLEPKRPARTDPDDLPDPPKPKTVPGDLWLLGPHRLLCGDSTDLAHVERLMDGDLADLVWTDPPYGVSYQTNLDDPNYARHRRQDGLTVSNDELTEEELRAFLRIALGNAHMHTRPGGGWYVASPGGPRHLDFGIVLFELELWRETLIWVKDVFVFGRQDYHWRHESIFYGWKTGAAHYFVDDRTLDTVFDIPRPKRSEEHPTMKPVELVARAIRNSTKPGAVVLDPFGGSGTTLMAAETEGRIARLLELDARYVDVICRRYQEHTGVLPIHAETQREHSFSK